MRAKSSFDPARSANSAGLRGGGPVCADGGRVSLITSVPALQGHSMLRYQDWCEVIAEFVASRLGCEPKTTCRR